MSTDIKTNLTSAIGTLYPHSRPSCKYLKFTSRIAEHVTIAPVKVVWIMVDKVFCKVEMSKKNDDRCDVMSQCAIQKARCIKLGTEKAWR